MKPCSVCTKDDPGAIVAVCDSADFHALCRDCAGPYLTTTLFSQSKVPVVGELVKCVGYGCSGMMSVEDLTLGMPPDEKKRVDTQIARSTISGMPPDSACNVVYCDMCEEFYMRDGSTATCVRCHGKGKLTAAYVPTPSQADAESEALIKQTTMPCLECGANINRSGGCNHMTCRVCQHEFCYECGSDWKKSACGPYICRAQQAAARDRKTKRNAKRKQIRSEREAEANGDVACQRCSVLGVRGANCPHVPLRPRGPGCLRECPRECSCEYSRWIMAWLQFRPSPGEPPRYFDSGSMAQATYAHLACVRNRGRSCGVCGLYGHDAQAQSSSCPLVELIIHRDAQGGAGTSTSAAP